MQAEEIQTLITQGLPGAKVWVRGDDGVHFDALVVCADFSGKLPLARHRMVYAVLEGWVGGAIHALSLKTYTPDEYAKAQEQL
jgi:acid stress-induced BolA-like protein IbaG/YrbA